MRSFSADIVGYRLTDQNYHSVTAERVTDGLVRLTAPAGYGVRNAAAALSLPIVEGWDVG